MTPASSAASADLFSRAQQVIPSGVNSPVRAFGSEIGRASCRERV